MDILRIKDENGVWQNVPALVGPPGKNGAQGEPGPAGSDGFSPIATVTQTETGATISIQDKSGTTTATITNGAKGEKGDKGDTGDQGPQGIQGIQGPQGPAGQDGYTPIKGTDYWTAADQAQIVQDVLAALPAAEEVSV